jgi:hypothetical protein
MRPVRALAGVSLLLALLVSTPSASAQSTEGLAGLLLRFFSPTNPVVLQGNQENPTFSHEAHFVSQPNAQELLRQINQGLATQLSTFPIGSSSAGFTFTFDETLGVYNRTAETFGPIFTERPLTAGKGKFTFGVNHQRATWDRLQGQDLEAGDINLYLVHEDTNRDGTNTDLWFEGDLIRADLSLSLTTETTVLFANYGLGERFDIGVAVPFQRVDLAASILTTIDPIATEEDPFVLHQFVGGEQSSTFTESGTASGIGDIVVRGKWNFLRKDSFAMAAAADLRLPTGDEADLLGSGATQVKGLLVLGGAPGRFSPRASVGYTFSSGGSDYTGDLPDEINYTAGFDLAPHPRVTLTADYIGRTLLDTDFLVETAQTFNFSPRTAPGVFEVQRATVGTDSGDLNLSLAAAGIRINPVGRLLIVFNALFALGSNGLQDDFTPLFGLDYTF